MNGWLPVFRGSPESARSLAITLDKGGVRSFVQDHWVQGARGGRYVESASVLVPPECQERAATVTRTWKTHAAGRPRTHALKVRQAAVWALLFPFTWLAAALLAPQVSMPSPQYLALAWLLGLVAFSWRGRRFSAEEPGPPSA